MEFYFLRGFSNNNSISNFIDIRPVGANVSAIAQGQAEKHCEFSCHFP
jgi:hypothetical protein